MTEVATNDRNSAKLARRGAIVAAAETLIREQGGTDFSMLMLAKSAGVSPTTPYNLFGTKGGILYALLDRSADEMFAETAPVASDPFSRTIAAADGLARVLVGDPDFYRPLYAFLMGVADDMWRPAFFARAKAYWVSGFDNRETHPLGLSRDALGRVLLIQALGCVEMWIHHEIADQDLARELRRACSIILIGLAPETAPVELKRLAMA